MTLFPPAQQQPEAQGTLTAITYHDPDSGFTIADLTPEGGAPLTVVGVIPGAVVGESLRVRGQWQTHPRYGRQLRIESYELIRPSTVEGIVAYLSGGLFKGIGQKKAQALVKHFGTGLLEVLDDQPTRLTEAPGIGGKLAETIAAAWQEHKEVHRIMVFLHEHGAGPTLASRIYQKYRGDAMRVLEREPYRLALEVRGVGFLTADRLARAAGISPADPQRLQAGLMHALSEALGDGHFFLPREALLYQAQRLLDCQDMLLEQALEHLVKAGEIIHEADPEAQAGYYLHETHEAEKELAGLILRLLDRPREQVPATEQVCTWLGQREAMGATALTPTQAEAVCAALRQPFTVITGGPGTGKTTITRAIAEAATNLRWKVALCSPTGRAAKRLTQLSGQAASTIHRLLSWDPLKRHFRFNAAEPLAVDLLIVDEASMVDAVLARDLLRAVPPGAQVVFIGDADQLPSVGPGNFLRDLIGSGVLPVVRLTEIFRQAEGGQIVAHAHEIRDGVMPQLVPGNKWAGEDCILMERETAEEAAQAVLKVVTRSLPGLGYGLRDTLVISPMHRGPVGVEALNQGLQEALNPAAAGKDELKRGHMVYREGDRVIQTTNDYDRHVYNGDIGLLTRLDPAARVAVVEFDGGPVNYDFNDLDQLDLAYALTVHKAQGSEYPAVVMVLHSTHYIMMRRNLLYTALTRAQKLAVIVGDKKGLWRAVRTADEAERYTRLAWRLRGELPHTPTPERLQFD
jgi:exodeoxyribonuclease V alpha subunit